MDESRIIINEENFRLEIKTIDKLTQKFIDLWYEGLSPKKKIESVQELPGDVVKKPACFQNYLADDRECVRCIESSACRKETPAHELQMQKKEKAHEKSVAEKLAEGRSARTERNVQNIFGKDTRTVQHPRPYHGKFDRSVEALSDIIMKKTHKEFTLKDVMEAITEYYMIHKKKLKKTSLMNYCSICLREMKKKGMILEMAKGSYKKGSGGETEPAPVDKSDITKDLNKIAKGLGGMRHRGKNRMESIHGGSSARCTA